MSIIRLPAVMNRTGLPRSTVYEKVKRGAFPSPISLGSRSVGWLESDIDDWIEARIEMSRGGRHEG
ncbi:MAG: AlpA family transcriptional regulator [Sphingomonadaceae bacterium]|nr:AlpA family transcriptional regulator [Sphingomonadaceae bacterium]